MAKTLPLILAAGAAVLLLGGKKKSSSSSKTASLPPLPKEFASPESFPKTTGPSDSGATPETWMLRQKTLAFLASQGVCGCDPGAIDGSYGASTKNAIIAFQKCSGLSPDGKWGAKTEAAAKEALSRIANRAKSPPSSSKVPKPAKNPLPSDIPGEYNLNPSEWAMAAPILASFGYSVTQDPLSPQSIEALNLFVDDFRGAKRYIERWRLGATKPWYPVSKNPVIDNLIFIQRELGHGLSPSWQNLLTDASNPNGAVLRLLDDIGYPNKYTKQDGNLSPGYRFAKDAMMVNDFLLKFYGIELPYKYTAINSKTPFTVSDYSVTRDDTCGFWTIDPIAVHVALRHIIPKYWGSLAELVWVAKKWNYVKYHDIRNGAGTHLPWWQQRGC